MSIEERKRRLFHRKTPYSAVKTVIPKTAVFECLTVYRYGKKTDWQAVRKHLKSFSKAVVFTEGTVSEQGSGIHEYKSNSLYSKMLVNTVAKMLEMSSLNPCETSLSILDKTGEMSGSVASLVPLAGRISVFTDNRMKYSFFASEMLETYGAVIRILDFNERKPKSDIILNISNSGNNPLSITLLNLQKSLSGGEIICPDKYKKYMPDKVDTYSFLSALYSLCSVSGLGSPCVLCDSERPNF